MAIPRKYSSIELAKIFAYKRMHPKAGNPELIKLLGISLREATMLNFVLLNEEPMREALRERPKYRVLLAGDFHCGHKAGLTPQGYQLPLDSAVDKIFAEFERESWDFFTASIDSLRPFTHAIFNGDLIDGDGKKSKGTELLTTDRNIQVDMAVKVIDTVGAKINVITYGTPYHTGDGEAFEYNIAQQTGAMLNAENLLSIGGVIFNVKHHTGGSSTPYGAATPLLKDALWSDLWAQLENNPTADIVVRSHTHTFIRIDDGFRTAVVLPALQGAMTKYGSLRMSKVVHWGYGYVDIFADGRYAFHEVLYTPESQKRQVITL
jgi:hypothetical protein